MSSEVLDILVCPVCTGALHVEEGARRLCCFNCRLAFPVREGIPVMLVSEAGKIPTRGDEGKGR
ncbi:MAG: Trm112 family protein [Geobacteraceae bacterium]|nr:Trm112 family protein [Geobacteraceae bacterium]